MCRHQDSVIQSLTSNEEVTSTLLIISRGSIKFNFRSCQQFYHQNITGGLVQLQLDSPSIESVRRVNVKDVLSRKHSPKKSVQLPLRSSSRSTSSEKGHLWNACLIIYLCFNNFVCGNPSCHRPDEVSVTTELM